MIATRVVLVTTTSARELVESTARELLNNYDDLEVEIIVTSAPVASLASTESILNDLLKYKKRIENADLVILPGMVRGSARKLEEVLGVPVVKGPRYVGDLPEMIALLKKGMRFSTDVPADDVIAVDGKKRLNYLLRKLNSVKPSFKMKNVAFTLRPPPLNLFYELCPAAFSNCRLRRFKNFSTLVEDLAKLGYSGVIIGCDVENCCYDDMQAKLLEVKKHGLLAGIDVYELSEVPREVLELTDMILNVTAKDIEIIARRVQRDVVLVLVPERTDSLSEAINSIRGAVKLAENAGFRKLVIDPILKPPLLGLSQSLMLLRDAISSIKYPFLAGPCNVYELMDADSPGIIALLTALLFEVGVSNLLITEASRKACGAAEEAAYARKMIYEAFARKSPPKDTLYNLLILKDKRKREVQPSSECLVSRRKIVEETIPPRMEEVYVKLYVNREMQRIIVDVHCRGEIIRYEGKNPLDLGRAIIREIGLAAEHAMYLGFELSKAYMALKTAKDYVQDDELFTWHGYLGGEAKQYK